MAGAAQITSSLGLSWLRVFVFPSFFRIFRYHRQAETTRSGQLAILGLLHLPQKLTLARLAIHPENAERARVQYPQPRRRFVLTFLFRPSSGLCGPVFPKDAGR